MKAKVHTSHSKEIITVRRPICNHKQQNSQTMMKEGLILLECR